MTPPTIPVPGAARSRPYKYYDLLMAAFVTVLLCSNLIGPAKTCVATVPSWVPLLGGGVLVYGAGNIFFPFSYIFDDVMTEVYGYARARRVIWAGFISMIFATIMSYVVIHLKTDPYEPYNQQVQPALITCFGGTWRIVLASMIAFWAGDFVNSYILAKMKIWTKGRMLWARTIGSTIVGEGLDTLIFYPIALMSWKPMLVRFGVTDPDVLQTFDGWTTSTAVQIMMFNWALKVMVEVLLTPVTYAVVGFLKRAEHEDYYDVNTNFNPFTLKD